MTPTNLLPNRLTIELNYAFWYRGTQNHGDAIQGWLSPWAAWPIELAYWNRGTFYESTGTPSSLGPESPNRSRTRSGYVRPR